MPFHRPDLGLNWSDNMQIRLVKDTSKCKKKKKNIRKPANLDELALKQCENKEMAVGISPVNRLTSINKNKCEAECAMQVYNKVK